MENNCDIITELLQKKFGINNINKAYLNIDYSKKTEGIGRSGNTVFETRPYVELLQLVKKTLTEEIP